MLYIWGGGAKLVAACTYWKKLSLFPYVSKAERETVQKYMETLNQINLLVWDKGNLGFWKLIPWKFCCSLRNYWTPVLLFNCLPVLNFLLCFFGARMQAGLFLSPVVYPVMETKFPCFPTTGIKPVSLVALPWLWGLTGPGYQKLSLSLLAGNISNGLSS